MKGWLRGFVSFRLSHIFYLLLNKTFNSVALLRVPGVPNKNTRYSVKFKFCEQCRYFSINMPHAIIVTDS